MSGDPNISEIDFVLKTSQIIGVSTAKVAEPGSQGTGR